MASPTEEAAVAETHSECGIPVSVPAKSSGGTNIDSVSRSHPGQKVRTEDISEKDQQWTDTGSGTFARTFKQTDKLRTTSRGGPCSEDVFRRKTWSLSTGKVIDDCEIDMVSDKTLNRNLAKVDDIRIKLTMKDAVKLFERKGPDVAELDSQPRLFRRSETESLEETS